MVKKLLLTLLILIVLVIAGIIALVVFVDPNNFKGYISETVKDKTGYVLTIEGDLRWHVWPQISILTDSVRLVDEGAKKPLLTADNMRLDVELLPLFSKQLTVKNVLVKSAIINISDDSKGQVAQNGKPTTTVNQKTEQNTDAKKPSNWRFTLNKLDIVDSTVVYQKDKDIINFRNIDLSVTQKDEKHVSIDFSGSVNRDQKDFIYALNADVNLVHFPESAEVVLNKLDYNYKGVVEAADQLKGQVTGTFNYQKTPMTMHSNDFALILNGNKITGKLQANLDKKPYFEGIFTSDKFDLTPFTNPNKISDNVNTEQISRKQPVVTSTPAKGNELAFLNNFDAKFSLSVNEVLFKKLVINQLVVNLSNKDGIATIEKADFDIANGHINAKGIANGKQSTTLIKLATKITDIDLGSLLSQLEMVNNLKGQLNANGNVVLTSINPDNIMKSLTGDLGMAVNNARFDNINLQQIVQDAVAKFWKKAVSSDDYQKYTSLHELSANATLANGDMNLSAIKAASSTLDMNGSGRIGLDKHDLDINLLVKILGGWNQDSKTIQKLQKVEIPLRIHGKFDQLQYQVNTDKLVSDVFNDKIQNELDRLKDRLNNKLKDTSNDTKNNDALDNNGDDEKEKVKDLIGSFLKKNKSKNKE